MRHNCVSMVSMCGFVLEEERENAKAPSLIPPYEVMFAQIAARDVGLKAVISFATTSIDL